MALQLSGSDFNSEKAIISIELYRKDVWRLGAVASGFNGGLGDLLRSYGGEEAMTGSESGEPAPPPPPDQPGGQPGGPAWGNPPQAAPPSAGGGGDLLSSLLGGGGLDMGLLTRLLPLIQELGGQRDSNARNLLYALRPYLRSDRQEKVERALQLARLFHLGKKFLSGWEG